MASKAKIYKEENQLVDADLINQLREAVEHLSEVSKATKPIFRSQCLVGYGVDKSQRSIAADAITSITKAIKSLGGW